MIMKRLFTLPLVLFIGIAAFATDIEIDNIFYSINEEAKTASVTFRDYNFNSYSEDVVVPSIIVYEDEEYTVTEIATNAFLQCTRLTSVTLPETITKINSNAFQGCSKLQTITIPSSVISIGSEAFSDCSRLNSITLPDGLQRLESRTFNECSSLKSIVIPENVTNIATSIFWGCSKLSSITLNCKSLKTIPEYFCYQCTSLTSINIPEGVKFIDKEAFSLCSNLKEVILPESLLEIGSNSFAYCTVLSDINIPSSITDIGEKAFGYTAISNIIIPDGVTEINKETFLGCTKLVSISLSKNITEIGNNAFTNCTQLQSIDIPEGVEIIPQEAFLYCESLSNITLPNTIKEIEADAFRSCTSLQTILLPNGLTTIGNEAFSDCANLQQIHIPETVTEIGNNAFSQCQLKKFTLPKTVTTIGSAILENTYSLEEITILNENPINLTSDAFYSVNKEIPVYIPCGSLESYTSQEYWKEFTNYIECNSVFRAICDEERGYIEKDGSFCSEFSITATAYDGYLFTGWSDGNTDNPRFITLTEDTLILEAIFAEIFYIEPSYELPNCESADGAITIEIHGGLPPYSIVWEDGSTENTLKNIAYGTHSISITDALGILLQDTLYLPRKELWELEPEISLVTVSQEAAPANLIVWKKEPSDVLDFYTIYRETAIKDQYEAIDTVSYNETSIYVDESANSLQKSYRYKLTVTDACGFESELSNHHKTIHLQKNVGIGGEVNLSWDGYEGVEFSTYSIFRVTTDTVEEIDKVTASSWTYTDLQPVEGTLSYYVGIVLPEVVDANDPLKAESGPFSLAISNIAELENNLAINSLKNNAIVYSKDKTIFIQNCENLPVSIYTADGKLQYRANGNTSYSIPVEKYASYIVVVGNKTNKIIVAE